MIYQQLSQVIPLNIINIIKGPDLVLSTSRPVVEYKWSAGAGKSTKMRCFHENRYAIFKVTHLLREMTHLYPISEIYAFCLCYCPIYRHL